MLFSLLKHYLDLYISDTVLKVSRSLYCFTTSICHGVNYFPRLWGMGISDAIFLFLRQVELQILILKSIEVELHVNPINILTIYNTNAYKLVSYTTISILIDKGLNIDIKSVIFKCCIHVDFELPNRKKKKSKLMLFIGRCISSFKTLLQYLALIMVF